MKIKIFEKFISKRLSNTKLLALDVDGVLTDGGIWIDNKGNVTKRFDIKDGLGIKLLQSIGVEVALISGGVSGATEKRAEQLGIKDCFTKVKNKSKIIIELKEKYCLNINEITYLGDDLNDLTLRDYVGTLIATNDACKNLKIYSDIILKKKGGAGAVRELSEKILRSKQKWKLFSKNGFEGLNN